MTITRETYNEEGKYGQESHIYEGFSSKALRSMGAVKDNFSQSTTISATFEKPSGTDGATMKEDIRGLLQHAGFKDIEIKDYGTSTFSVSMVQREGQGLMNVVMALSQTIDMGKGETLFAVINLQDARAMVAQELERTGMTPQQAGLVRMDRASMSALDAQLRGLSEAPAYTDVDLAGYPLSPIARISENSRMAGSKFGGAVAERTTEIYMKDNSASIQVQKTLEDAGLSPRVSPDGTRVTVDVTADVALQHLARSGLLMDSIAADIGRLQNAPQAVSPEPPKLTPPPVGMGA